jgi:hypothetical protein
VNRLRIRARYPRLGGSSARGLRTLGGPNVNGAQEAAQALAYLVEGTQERFDALVTDADGTPFAAVGAFNGIARSRRQRRARYVGGRHGGDFRPTTDRRRDFRTLGSDEAPGRERPARHGFRRIRVA